MIGNILKKKKDDGYGEAGFGMVLLSSEMGGPFQFTATADTYFLVVRDGLVTPYISDGNPKTVSFTEDSSPGKNTYLFGGLTKLVVGEEKNAGTYLFSTSGMNGLTDLQLNNSTIGKFSKVALPALERLKISDYPIIPFSEFDGSGSPELKHLDLTDCSLESLDLSGNRKLETILLNGCLSLTDAIFPKFSDVPVGNGGLKNVSVSGTALSFETVFEMLPVRNALFPGVLHMDMPLDSEEEAALQSKFWELG